MNPQKIRGFSQTLYSSKTKWNGKILSFDKPLNKTLHIQQPPYKTAKWNNTFLYKGTVKNSTILKLNGIEKFFPLTSPLLTRELE